MKSLEVNQNKKIDAEERSILNNLIIEFYIYRTIEDVDKTFNFKYHYHLSAEILPYCQITLFLLPLGSTYSPSPCNTPFFQIPRHILLFSALKYSPSPSFSPLR